MSREFLVLFLRSWLPAPDQPVYQLWRRWLVLLLFWPLLLALLLINGSGLALDRLFFPGYRHVRIRAPVFVIGIPRSGTTFLHRLLALDRRFSTTALWELVFAPSITQRYFWLGFARLDRLAGAPLARLLASVERRVLGKLDDIHGTGLAAPEEDYLALAPVLGCFLLVLPLPDERLWRLARGDQALSGREKRRILGFYRGIVQRHLWFHGPERTLLSKNPSFTPLIESLVAEFPDARFVACFRNPTRAVPSQINAILVGARIFRGRDIDADYWRDRLTDMLCFYYRHLFETLPNLPGCVYAQVLLEELAPRPYAAVMSVYQQFGWTPDEGFDSALKKEEERARHYQSNHQYSLTGVALPPQRLSRDFGFVYRHLGYPLPESEQP
ncbi:sulfotransferase [Marinobacter lacisalsi]|uniref:Sulfotransferase n=1 Tax=Marinobacter lacisalsi TaxID=475979 RepID=A0ABV8QMS8_9GAMM